MNRPLSRKHTLHPFSVPTEIKTASFSQSQRKLWEAVQSVKLDSRSVMGATEEGLFPGGSLVSLVSTPPLLQLLLLLISSSGLECLRLKVG